MALLSFGVTQWEITSGQKFLQTFLKKQSRTFLARCLISHKIKIDKMKPPVAVVGNAPMDTARGCKTARAYSLSVAN